MEDKNLHSALILQMTNEFNTLRKDFDRKIELLRSEVIESRIEAESQRTQMRMYNFIATGFISTLMSISIGVLIKYFDNN